MLRGLFVVGTDTGVGKTFVASLIVRSLVAEGRRVGALKPVATGAFKEGDGWQSDDVEILRSALGNEVPRERICPLLYEAPLAPCVAARRAGRPLGSQELDGLIDETLDWWSERAEILVVEGIGGFLCPLSETTTVADLAVKLDYPLVIVSRRNLGTLNHTLMTVEAARSRDLRIAGIVLNSADPGSNPLVESTNARELARRLPGIAILAEIPHATEKALHDPRLGVDWSILARITRRLPTRPTTTVPQPIAIEEAGRPMNSDVIEPGAVPDAPKSPPDQDRGGQWPEPAPSTDADTLMGNSSSTSGDELSVILTQAKPDPLLGEFDNPLPSGSEDSQRKEFGHDRRDAFNALSALEVSATDLAAIVLPAGIPTSSTEALASLNLGEPTPIAPHSEMAVAAKPTLKAVAGDDEPDEPQGIPLSTLLLASYASAVTLGLIWVLWSGRRVKETFEPEPIPAIEANPDPGRRARSARRIVPPPPIAADHLTNLGKAVTLGEIEVTPLGVTSGRVVLIRDFNEEEWKSGGKNTLKLRLRLKNISTEKVLAPLDEAYLRPRSRSDPESYIETSGENLAIPLYALAVESEWSIVGQEFRELRPGEVFESLVVSEPDAVAKETGEMTWRIRLRTDINHTDDLGVRFHKEDVIAEPEPDRRDKK